MATLLFDDFDGPLTSGYWGPTLPPEGDPNAPSAGDGFLHLYAPQSPVNAYQTNVGTSAGYPLRCTAWSMAFGDVPFDDIYAGDFFGASFVANGESGIFSWQLRWQPSTVPPPEPTGTDTEVVLFASWVTFPPFADNDESTPITFDPVAHKYLRIREECLEVVWEYSADGEAWTEGFTATLPGGYGYGTYSLVFGMRAGYEPAIDFPIDWARIELDEVCPCQTGWRIGGPKSGNTPW